jgi:hypothetical protein
MQPFIYGVFYISQKSKLINFKIEPLENHFFLGKSKKTCKVMQDFFCV